MLKCQAEDKLKSWILRLSDLALTDATNTFSKKIPLYYKVIRKCRASATRNDWNAGRVMEASAPVAKAQAQT